MIPECLTRQKALIIHMPDDQNWFLYMIECRGNGIYVGISKDVNKRYEQHVAGRGSRYTKINKPVQLLARVKVGDYGLARKVEKRFKKLTPIEKRHWANALGKQVDAGNFPVSILLSDVDNSGH